MLHATRFQHVHGSELVNAQSYELELMYSVPNSKVPLFNKRC